MGVMNMPVINIIHFLMDSNFMILIIKQTIYAYLLKILFLIHLDLEAIQTLNSGMEPPGKRGLKV